ncbi:MAG: uroporphyrinogen-III synthase [Acidimicrobiales bacterium]
MPLLPLEGYVVGVTADRRWAEQAELLERRGAVVMHAPTISTEYLGSDDALRAATDEVIARPPDYLVATTGIGVRAWFEAAQTWGRAADLLEALSPTRIIARGPKASAAVQVAGLTVWASPDTERLDDALRLLGKETLSGTVVAFQHYGERDERARAMVTDAGGRVLDVPVYRYRRPPDEDQALELVDAVRARSVDAVTFTSAPAVRNLVDAAARQGSDAELLAACNDGSVVVACIGPICAAAAQSVGIRAPVAPRHGRLGLLVRALTDVLQTRRRVFRCGPADVVLQGRAVSVDDERVDLSARERAVLDVLLQRPGAVLAKPAILRALGSDPTAIHALETTVARLRGHLGPAGPAVRAARGRGYSLDASPPK